MDATQRENLQILFVECSDPIDYRFPRQDHVTWDFADLHLQQTVDSQPEHVDADLCSHYLKLAPISTAISFFLSVLQNSKDQKTTSACRLCFYLCWKIV